MLSLALPSASFQPLRWQPGQLGTWSGHIPFAVDLISALQPKLLVELGTHYGESYFTFCQAVVTSGISCSCFAVDTWRGDAHSGFYGDEVFEEVSDYNNAQYGRFSTLLRMTFDEALRRFQDETIDLLHIDGLHTYSAVRHDFDLWLPRVKPGGIILLHDIAIRQADFGVWKLWEELSHEYTTFDFQHSYGLGVLLKGRLAAPRGGILKALFDHAVESKGIRDYYVVCAERLALENRALIVEPCINANSRRLQVFFNLGGKYSEENSVSADLTLGEWHNLRFDLPFGIGNGPLRIDPVDCSAVVEITELTLRKLSDDILIARLADNEIAKAAVGGTSIRLPDEGLLRLFSYGDDPRILVSFNSFEVPKEPLALEIKVRVQLDLSVIASLISGCWATERNLRGNLASAQSETEELTRKLADAEVRCASEIERSRSLLESRSWRLTAPLRHAAALFRREAK